MTSWTTVAPAVAEVLGVPVDGLSAHGVGGGCISSAFRVESDDDRDWFLKINTVDKHAMFAAEAFSLRRLAEADAVRVPAVLGDGVVGDFSFLLLEHLDLAGPKSPEVDARLGRELAQLHRFAAPDGRFGWDHDNVIGEGRQPNAWHDTWLGFFREHRLHFQVDQARAKGLALPRADELLDGLGAFLDHDPVPSLLHGDLWGGNAAALADGTPVIFDPASYYGDRETDIAFTTMFGGFGPSFYEAYEEEWPLPAGWQRRRIVYNLYHVLNHHHHFGGSYGAQAEGIVGDLVRLLD